MKKETSINHCTATFAKRVLCSRCGFLALNFNMNEVFCSFLWVGKNIFDK